MQHTVADATNTSSGPAVIPEQFFDAVALLEKKAPMTVMSSGLPTCICAASTGLIFAKLYIGGFSENLSRVEVLQTWLRDQALDVTTDVHLYR